MKVKKKYVSELRLNELRRELGNFYGCTSIKQPHAWNPKEKCYWIAKRTPRLGLPIHYVPKWGKRPACGARYWYLGDAMHVTCKNCIRTKGRTE